MLLEITEIDNKYESLIENYLVNEKNVSGYVNKKDSRFRACVSFPEIYEIAILNVGMQIVYKELNKLTNWNAGRSFLIKDNLDNKFIGKVWETGENIKNLDLWFISVACEANYLNVVKIIKDAGIALRSDSRTDTEPIIIGGGFVGYNPEPLMDFFDLFIIGDAEEIISKIALCYEKLKKDYCRKEIVEKLAEIQGIYSYTNDKNKVERLRYNDFEINRTSSAFITKLNLKDRKIYSIESVRGCNNGCAFCCLGNVLPKMTSKNEDILFQEIERDYDEVEEVKLVFPSSMDVKLIKRLLSTYTKIRVGSLRADFLDYEILEMLSNNGQKNISLAPESSEKIRFIMGKRIENEVFFNIIRNCLRLGYKEITLFLIVGFPGETIEDIFELIDFVKEILNIVRNSDLNIILSINPFFAKPGTPLQWAQIEDMNVTYKKLSLIRGNLENEQNLIIESLVGTLEHYRQNLLSRGERQLSSVLIEVESEIEKGAKETIDLWRSILRKNNIFERDLFRERGIEEVFTWDKYTESKEYLIRRWCSICSLVGKEPS